MEDSRRTLAVYWWPSRGVKKVKGPGSASVRAEGGCHVGRTAWTRDRTAVGMLQYNRGTATRDIQRRIHGSGVALPRLDIARPSRQRSRELTMKRLIPRLLLVAVFSATWTLAEAQAVARGGGGGGSSSSGSSSGSSFRSSGGGGWSTAADPAAHAA